MLQYDYGKLTRTITINVLDFCLFDQKEEAENWHSCFGVYDIKTGKQLTTDLEMHFIELPKWNIQKNAEQMNSFERWISYFDRKTTAKELEAIAMQEPMIQEALQAEYVFTQDEINRRTYELREKAERDYRGQMMYATKQGLQQGLQQGMAKMKTLIQCLIDDGREAEIPVVIADEQLQKELLSKYNIT